MPGESTAWCSMHAWGRQPEPVRWPSPAVGRVVKGVQVCQLVPPDYVDHDECERGNDAGQVLVKGHPVV